MISYPRRIDRMLHETDNERPMEVKLAVIADAANVSQEGKLNILGAFNVLFAETAPARHPEMVLVLNLEASPAEAGRDKALEIRMLAADGESVGGMKAEFRVPDPKKPGRPIQMQSVLRLNDVSFPRFGDYGIHVLINEEEKAHIPLALVKRGGDEDGA